MNATNFQRMLPRQIKRLLTFLQFNRKSRLNSSTKATDILKSSVLENDYFTQAKTWADDLQTNAILSKNRYRLAFFVAMGLACLLTIVIMSLIPLQRIEPLLINHYQDGRISIEPISQPYAPTNQAQVESDIVRYVINRESYNASSYQEQYSLVNLMSNQAVANQYIQAQSSLNKVAPINVLGNQGYRTIHIDSVIFLDSFQASLAKATKQIPHHNLAQVDFTITDHFMHSAFQKTKDLVALVSWIYRGTPENPADRWRNWDGFTVTRYTVVQRNISINH